MNNRWKKIPLLLFLAMIISLTACHSRTQSAESSAPVNSSKSAALSEASQAEPVVIRLAGGDFGVPNPFRHTPRGPGIQKMRLIYDSLLEKDENGYIPWLAKEWESNDAKTEYTFTLQEDVYWHDGTPFTAEDVAFTFRYYEEHPPVSDDIHANGKSIIRSIEVLEPLKIKITLEKFANTNLGKLGTARIIPKHIWENVEDPINFAGEGQVVGCGPFVMTDYEPQTGSYRYVAFEHYWGPKHAVGAIEWIPVSNSTLAFENGEIDLLNVSADLLERYEGNPEYQVDKQHPYHAYRLMMNMKDVPALQNQSVRQALAYAANRQELIDKVDRGAGTIASMGYIPDYDKKWYNPDIKQYEFNLAKAKELLGGQTYHFEMLAGDMVETKIAELLKLSYEQVGINITIKTVDTKTRDGALKQGNYELLLIHTGGMSGDPDYLRTIYGEKSTLLSGYSNPTINALARAQATEADEAKRLEMIHELQRLIAEDVPIVLLQSDKVNYVYRPAKYKGWVYTFDSNKPDHNKLSYLTKP